MRNRRSASKLHHPSSCAKILLQRRRRLPSILFTAYYTSTTKLKCDACIIFSRFIFRQQYNSFLLFCSRCTWFWRFTLLLRTLVGENRSCWWLSLNKAVISQFLIWNECLQHNTATSVMTSEECHQQPHPHVVLSLS